MTRDILKRREYARNYWRRTHKKTEKPPSNTEFDQYSYRVVPNHWRDTVNVRPDYAVPEITSPLVLDLFAGKTVFVDYEVPLGQHNHPFRTLYAYFNARGYKLRVYVADDITHNEYRKLLMWADPLVRRKRTQAA